MQGPLSSCQYQAAQFGKMYFQNSHHFDVFSLSGFLSRLLIKNRGGGDWGKMQDRASKGKLNKRGTQSRCVPVVGDPPGIQQSASSPALTSALTSARWMRRLNPTCPRIQGLQVAVYSWQDGYLGKSYLCPLLGLQAPLALVCDFATCLDFAGL
jgi:hypothetical protein